MLLLMAVYAFLNELKQQLIKPNCMITVEINNSGDGLRFNFYWLDNDEKIDIHYVLLYEEVRSIHDNQIAIRHITREVNKKLQEKFDKDLFKF